MGGENGIVGVGDGYVSGSFGGLRKELLELSVKIKVKVRLVY